LLFWATNGSRDEKGSVGNVVEVDKSFFL
jgi:hypothetical protein